MKNDLNQWRLKDFAYDACVRQIYHAATGIGTWNQVCEGVSEAFGLSGLIVFGVNKRNKAVLFHWEGGPFEPYGAMQYITRYHRENPWLEPAISLSGDNWLHDHELFNDALVDGHPYYQQFAIPNGARYTSVVKLADDSEQVVLLCAMRSERAGPLVPNQIHEIDRLRHHFVDALHIYRDVHTRISNATGGHSMLDALPQAVFVTDEMRHIFYRNRAASQLIENDPSFHPGNVLTLIDEHDDARLTAMVHSMTVPDSPQNRATGPTGNGFVIRIGDPKLEKDLVVVGRAFRSVPGAGHESAGLIQMMLIVHPIRSVTDFDPSTIGSIFQLTPAEAIVAAALARGETPEEVAKGRGVSLHTIRTQIRAVYTKMKVTRQADLARLLAQIPKLED